MYIEQSYYIARDFGSGLVVAEQGIRLGLGWGWCWGLGVLSLPPPLHTGLGWQLLVSLVDVHTP